MDKLAHLIRERDWIIKCLKDGYQIDRMKRELAEVNAKIEKIKKGE